MKQSHLTTPRTLSECHFTPGYTSHGPQNESMADRIKGFALACVIGCVLAAALFYGWSN
ncbi:hypothetical protein UFOVP312_22 [uncultured Caudovirales phage]|uniref:Uncharacterized protein n=1 Tax=uncultured Caudovirales phage TaxID=2100421 RepID=A0A6J5LQN0_9CAUD|nr:hypothetical protein UFOVP312_22 [uncultured Caudovirales phage]